MFSKIISIGVIPLFILMIEAHQLRQYIKENKKQNPEWTFKKDGWDDCCRKKSKKSEVE